MIHVLVPTNAATYRSKLNRFKVFFERCMRDKSFAILKSSNFAARTIIIVFT